MALLWQASEEMLLGLFSSGWVIWVPFSVVCYSSVLLQADDSCDSPGQSGQCVFQVLPFDTLSVVPRGHRVTEHAELDLSSHSRSLPSCSFLLSRLEQPYPLGQVLHPLPIWWPSTELSPVDEGPPCARGTQNVCDISCAQITGMWSSVI